MPAGLPPVAYVVVALLLAYLLGSISFAVIVSRVFGLADPRSYGSKNPGATNVLRSGNKIAALLTLLGDGAKGAVAVLLAQKFGPDFGFGPATVAAVALAVFCGHLYPVFLRFKGGKGVATAAGVLLALDLALGLSVLGVWLGTALVFRYSSLAAILAAAAAPLIAGMMWGFNGMVMAVGLMSMALIGKHWENLQRLFAGTETRIGEKKKAAARG
jgi:glycerol-3-phosphate acyltransferase PlsY